MSVSRIGKFVGELLLRLERPDRQRGRKRRSRQSHVLEQLEARALLANITASVYIREILPPAGGPPTQSSPYHIYGMDLNNASSSDSGIGTFWFAWVPGKDLLATQPISATPLQSGWSYQITHTGAGDGYGIEFTADSAHDVRPGDRAAFLFETTDTLQDLFGNSPSYPDTPVLSSVVYPQGPGSDAGHPLVATAYPPGDGSNPSPEPPVVTVTSVSLGTPPTGSPRVQEQSIVIHFSGALNAAEADHAATYHLVMSGKRGSFAAKNSRAIGIASASYDPASNTVVLRTKKPFSLTKPLQLTIHGTGASGLQDAEGRLIDGNDDGQPGGDAVFVITSHGVE